MTIFGDVYRYKQGQGSLLVSVPHAGRQLTESAKEKLNDTGIMLSDTDWHVERLCKGLGEQDISVLEGLYSRYIVDLNRSSDNKPLYNTATTGLFPDIQFDGEPIWKEERDPEEDSGYLENIWLPYHQKLEAELGRIRDIHGYALLLDLHSIKSEIPRLFEGRLPELNVGTNSGNSCDSGLERLVTDLCEQNDRYSYVINGRFKGGFITREYGRPRENLHAIQVEIARRAYMAEDGMFTYNAMDAERLIEFIRKFVDYMRQWGETTYGREM